MNLWRKHYKEILVAVLIAMIVLPFLLIAFFAFPSDDDFSYSVMMSSDAAELFTWGAVKAAVSAIISNGYILASFWTFLFSPLRYFGIAGIRLTIFLTNVLFLVSCLVFIKWVLKGIFKDNKPLHWMMAYFLYIACFISFFYQAEIFTWAVCSTGYLMTISCLQLGLAFLIRASLSPKKSFWLASGLFGVISVMGPMNITTLACGLYVSSLLLLMINQKYSKWALAVTLAVIAVGILPLFSPGTWARHESSTVHQDLLAPLVMDVNAFGTSIKQILCSPVALILCVSGVLAFQWAPSSKKFPWANLAVVSLVAVLGPVIVMFPYFFGYGSTYYPPRAQFVMDFTVVLGLFGLIAALCAFVKSRVGDAAITKRQALPLLIVMAMFFGNIAITYDWRELLPLKVAHDAADGKLMRTHAYWTETFAKWAQSEGQDVKVILEDHYGYQLPYLVYPFVHYDPAYWTNQHIAEYYHMNSIVVQYYQDYIKGE